MASCNISVVPYAKGNSGTAVWDCVLGPSLSGPSLHSEMKRIVTSILGEPIKITFFSDSVPLKFEGVEATNYSLENFFLCKLISHKKTFVHKSNIRNVKVIKL